MLGKREDSNRKVVPAREARQISRSHFWTLAKSKRAIEFTYQILGLGQTAAIREHAETDAWKGQ